MPRELTKYISNLKNQPKINSLKETGGKKSVQYGLLAIAALFSQIMKAVNKELFDFLATFILLIFIASLVLSIILMDRRDKKIRASIVQDFKQKYEGKTEEIRGICEKCSQSNSALLFDMKNTFDEKIIEQEKEMETVIRAYQNVVDTAINIYILEKLKFDQLIANMSGMITGYDKISIFRKKAEINKTKETKKQ